MLLPSLPTVLVSVLAIASSALASPTRETNAERLARGLPPLPPANLRRSVPGEVGARHPTPVWAAKRHKPSGGPPVVHNGRIQARTNDGSILGIVRNSSPPGGLNFLGPDQDLNVKISAPADGSPFDILAGNPKFPAPYYIGASGTTFSSSIGPGSRSVVAFTNVQQTPAGSKPVSSGDRVVESAIWTIDPNTKELTAHYVNPDGSTPATIIAYDIRANSLFFVGDIDAYNKDNNTPASAIKLFVV